MAHSDSVGATSRVLDGKFAVVMGGGRGMGRATALTLASLGASIVVVARTHSELAEVVAEAEADGGHARAITADVTRSVDMTALADELRKTCGRVDILVNCAGVSLIAPLSATSEADWDRVVDTNLKGVYLCVHAMLDLLRAADGALVVNIASKVGLIGHSQVTAYTAAKAGLIGFSRALAQELNTEDIRVVTVCPGPVDTPMRWAATPHMDRKLTIPADTVAKTISFLATMGARVTLGSELVVEALGYDPNATPLD